MQDKSLALAIINRHVSGHSRMPLLVTGLPGTGRFYEILRAIAATTDGTAAQRVLNRTTQDVIHMHGDDSIGDMRDAIEDYRTREQPAELNHKHIIVRALDRADNKANDLLLKLLEEPPSSTIITVTARDRGSIMPAIVSRTLHVNMPPHDNESMRQVLMTRPDLKAAMPTLGRHFPPQSTNEARYRFRYNLDNIAEAVSRGEYTPSELRTEALKIIQSNKDRSADIILILIRLVERHLSRKVRTVARSSKVFADIHKVTEKCSTRFIEGGNPEFATSLPNGALLTLNSLLCLAILIK